MLNIKIITPLGLYKEAEIEALHVRSVEGEMTLLPNHIPVVAMLDTCKCRLRIQGEYEDYALAGGMLHLVNNEVRILTDAIEGQAEIDLERAQKAKERAERRLAKMDNATNMQRAEIALHKAINRINVHG